MIISPIQTSQTKRDTDATIYSSADEAYAAVDADSQPAAYVAEEQPANLRDGGAITIGDNDPASDVPLRTGYSFSFFLRTYPLDVSTLNIHYNSCINNNRKMEHDRLLYFLQVLTRLLLTIQHVSAVWIYSSCV